MAVCGFQESSKNQKKSVEVFQKVGNLMTFSIFLKDAFFGVFTRTPEKIRMKNGRRGFQINPKKSEKLWKRCIDAWRSS